MSENPDSGIAEDEEMTSHLLGLLYPDEMPDDAGEESDYEDQAELSEFRSLLGHFRDMPQEDPPAAVSNKLLAMAAKHAPAKAKEERKGIFAWLSDFLLPTVYHPGLASAASLVLIAGLAGTLYVNGKSQVAEPMVATQATAPQEEVALGTSTLAEPTDVPAAALEEASDSLADSEEPMADPEAASVAAEDERARAQAPAKESADEGRAFKAEAKRDSSLDGNLGGLIGSGKGGGGDRGGDAFSDAPSTKTTSKGSAEKSNIAAPDSTSVTSRARKKLKTAPPTDDAKDAKPKAPVAKPRPAPVNRDKKAPEPEPDPTPAPVQKNEAPPPPPSGGVGNNEQEIADEGDDDGDDNDAEDVSPDESKVNPAVEAAALHKKAIAAAKNKQCSKVKSLGQMIRKLSSSYYDRTFLSDKRLTDCLAPEVKK